MKIIRKDGWVFWGSEMDIPRMITPNSFRDDTPASIGRDGSSFWYIQSSTESNIIPNRTESRLPAALSPLGGTPRMKHHIMAKYRDPRER
jgi:hypothetical protein